MITKHQVHKYNKLRPFFSRRNYLELECNQSLMTEVILREINDNQLTD